jgi:hypothetical protein
MPCAIPVQFAAAWCSAEKLGKIILSRSTRALSTTRCRSAQRSQFSPAVGPRGLSFRRTSRFSTDCLPDGPKGEARAAVRNARFGDGQRFSPSAVPRPSLLSVVRPILKTTFRRSKKGGRWHAGAFPRARGSFDEIIAQGVLKHFERNKTLGGLAGWSRLLHGKERCRGQSGMGTIRTRSTIGFGRTRNLSIGERTLCTASSVCSAGERFQKIREEAAALGRCWIMPSGSVTRAVASR